MRHPQDLSIAIDEHCRSVSSEGDERPIVWMRRYSKPLQVFKTIQFYISDSENVGSSLPGFGMEGSSCVDMLTFA